MMTMMNMCIISSCREHLKEANDRMGDGVWGVGLGGWELDGV